MRTIRYNSIILYFSVLCYCWQKNRSHFHTRPRGYVWYIYYKYKRAYDITRVTETARKVYNIFSPPVKRYINIKSGIRDFVSIPTTMTNNNLNNPRSRSGIFSLLAVTIAVTVLVHQPATVRCADGEIISPQQKQLHTMEFTAPSGYYVSTYDHIDVGRLLRNNKVVSGYVKCFVNEGPCTPDGKLAKGMLKRESCDRV